jgi:hypothetical protein
MNISSTTTRAACPAHFVLYSITRIVFAAEYKSWNLVMQVFFQSWLNLNLLTWRIWRAPNSARKWQMWFNPAFKGLTSCLSGPDGPSALFSSRQWGLNEQKSRSQKSGRTSNFTRIFLFRGAVSHDFLTIEASRSHSDTTNSVGVLWASDHPCLDTSTWQHTTL